MYNIELRQLQGNKLECLVNNYGWSKFMTDKQGKKFRESISKEVWENAIARNSNIKVFLNHQDYVELGNNIQVSATTDGVMLSLELSDKELGLYRAAEQNRLTGCSFGFCCLDEKVTDCGSYYEREVLSMELYEISLLDKTPAYNNTTIEARELNLFKHNLMLKEIELLQLA